MTEVVKVRTTSPSQPTNQHHQIHRIKSYWYPQLASSQNLSTRVTMLRSLQSVRFERGLLDLDAVQEYA